MLSTSRRVSISALVTTAVAVLGIAVAPPGFAHPITAQAAHPLRLAKPGPAPAAPRAPRPAARPASLRAVRRSENAMAKAHRVRPSFAAAATTFTVNTTEDSDLATAGSTTCVDAASGACSLRAAVDAANNLGKPVQIVVPASTYTLLMGTALVVTNPGGTSITGAGASTTSIAGSGSGILQVSKVSGAASGLLFLTGMTLTGGATTEGGAVYLADADTGEVVLDHDVLTGNSATTAGGGIYAGADDTVYATDTTITDNVSPEGAGAYEDSTDAQYVRCTITHNTSPSGSTGTGSGLYNAYGVVTVRGGSISNNVAGDASHAGYGAGIFDEYASLTLTKVTVDKNVVDDGGTGGALYAYYDRVDITGGTMSHNTATNGYGGAIYIEYGTQLGLHGATLAGNTVTGTDAAGVGGGAIYDYAYDYSNQVTIDSGSSITSSNNSAVYVYAYYGNADLSVNNSTLSGNSDSASNGMSISNGSAAYGCGGAICALAYEYSSINLAMSGDKVSGNRASGEYGAGAATVFSDEYSQATSTLTDTTFANNQSGVYGFGGALLFWGNAEYSPQSVRLNSDQFSTNSAGENAANSEGFGGAVGLYYYTDLIDNGSTFAGNEAIGPEAYGGALYNGSYQAATFSGTTMTGNSVGAGTSSGVGGAVYSVDESGDQYTDVTLSKNAAASAGGALYDDTDGYNVSFTDSTISGNTAGSSSVSGSGGGLYVGDGSLVLDDSTVSGNTAAGSSGVGGGIWQAGYRFGLRYSTVSGNDAASGGGVYTSGGGGSVLGSIVSFNHAGVGGVESDCAAATKASKLSSAGGNVLGQSGCVAGAQSSDAITKAPGLNGLANNGGPTMTMRLKKTSPAIGRGTYACPAADQRGQARPSTGCDAGAYQRAAAKVVSLSPSKGKAGQAVTIKGTGFTFATSVTFGSKSVKFTVVSNTRIATTAPSGLSGAVPVTVKTPDGSAGSATFTYKK